MSVSGIPGLERFELIGRGGMASVYRAYQPELDRWVAVKLIPLPDEASRRRFDRERKAMGRLSQHPAIATIFESGVTVESEGYLVMSDYRKGSLQQRIDAEGPLPWEEGVRLLLTVVDAVAHAHSQSVLHLDLKPSNILLDSEGRPHVADFGLAALLEEGELSSVSAASPAYSSPEMLAGGRRSPRSDVYGLGATLYTTMAGTAPFAAGSGAAIDRVLREPVPALAGVPDDLARVVAKAMAKAPEDRWGSAEAFGRALAGAAGLNVRQPARWMTGWKAATIWTTTALAVTAAGVLVVSKSTGDPPATTVPIQASLPPGTESTAPTTPPPTVTTAPPTTEQAPTGEVLAVPIGGIPQTPVPAGEAIWVVRDEAAGPGSLVRIDPGSGAVTDVIRVGNRPRGPAVTDDALWVFNVADATVSRVSMAERTVTDVIELAADGFVLRTSLAHFDPQVPVAGHGAVWVPATSAGRLFRVDVETFGVTSFSFDSNPVAPNYDQGYISTPLVTADGVWIAGNDPVCIQCPRLAYVPDGRLEAAERYPTVIPWHSMTPLVDGELVAVIGTTSDRPSFRAGIPPLGDTFRFSHDLSDIPTSAGRLGNEWWVASTNGVVELVELVGDSEAAPWRTLQMGSSLGGVVELDGRLWGVDVAASSLLVMDPAGVVEIVAQHPGLAGRPVFEADAIWLVAQGEVVRVRVQL